MMRLVVVGGDSDVGVESNGGGDEDDDVRLRWYDFGDGGDGVRRLVEMVVWCSGDGGGGQRQVARTWPETALESGRKEEKCLWLGTGTNNVAPNVVVAKELPQLLDTRGVLENRPFVPKSLLSTSTNVLPKSQKQWSSEDRRLASQDKRLKSIIISCLPNDDNDLDVEEDTRSNSEFLSDLNDEFHDRAFLANQKRFYKRSRRVGSAIKPMDDESLSSEDEGVTRVKAFMAIAEDETTVGKVDARAFLGNIVHTFGGRGKRKETISSKGGVFTKTGESPSKTIPEITYDSKSEYEYQEPLPPLPKLLRDEPIGTSSDVTPPANLTQASAISDKTKHAIDKELPVKAIKKKG
ncbi:hypothetical protein Tco_0737597 [Tanacetum coccineum]